MSMLDTPTPGPWRLEEARDGHFMIHGALGSPAHIVSLAHVKTCPDANLIMAAPLLLAACELALKMLDLDVNEFCSTSEDVEKIRFAIEEARGGA
jgi:hypothetical protein